MTCVDDNKIFISRKAPSELLPPRDSEGHKGTFGKVLLIVGSLNMAGAAILAARAAYRSGAGMVKVISPECNRTIIQVAVPEALYMPAESSSEKWQKAFEWCDVVGIGSGLGTDENAKTALKRALTMTDKPMVVDADALNVFKSVTDGIDYNLLSGRKMVFTPHAGELARLVKAVGSEIGECGEFGEQSESVKMNSSQLNNEQIDSAQSSNVQIDSAMMISRTFGCVVAAKSADTYVVDASEIYSEGNVFRNDRGNSGMATAGSGDVLAGCITALMGQGLNPFEAACAGVQLHAIAGDRAAAAHSEAWIMASDICDNLGLDM